MNATLVPPALSQFCTNALSTSLVSIILGTWSLTVLGVFPAYSLRPGVFLTLGSCAAYVPQHLVILKNKSVAGLSWVMLLLANISSVTVLAAALGYRMETLTCCSSDTPADQMFHAVSFWECQQLILPLYQVMVAALNYYPLFIMYLIFRDVEEERKTNSSPIFSRFRCLQSRHWAPVSFILFSLIFIVGLTGALSALLYFLGTTSPTVARLSFSFGILSSVCTATMYIPQIMRTFQDKHPGSLSLAMLCIQAPGNLLTVYFQAIASGQPVTAWLPYLVAAVEQIILIVLGMYYKILDKRGKQYEGEEGGPLLDVQETKEKEDPFQKVGQNN